MSVSVLWSSANTNPSAPTNSATMQPRRPTPSHTQTHLRNDTARAPFAKPPHATHACPLTPWRCRPPRKRSVGMNAIPAPVDIPWAEASHSTNRNRLNTLGWKVERSAAVTNMPTYSAERPHWPHTSLALPPPPRPQAQPRRAPPFVRHVTPLSAQE